MTWNPIMLDPRKLIIVLVVAVAAPVLRGQQGPPLVPPVVPLSPTVRDAVDDRLLKDEERTAMRLFHGLYGELDDAAKQSPQYALAIYDLNNASLQSADTPPLIRAEAAYLRGDMHQVVEILAEDPAPQAALLRGRAFAAMGRYDQAIAALSPLRTLAKNEQYDTAAQATAIAEGLAELTLLEGRPGSEYQFTMDLLSTAQQQLDRLYWPAVLAQARLLIEKDNAEQAVPALHQTLRMNPNCSEAWFLLGRVALMGFDFNSAALAAFRLRQINPDHVLADILAVESALTQKDAAAAQATLVPALLRYPNHRQLMACSAAVAALRYDAKLVDATLKQFEAVAGTHPLAYFIAGKYLSSARQYDASEKMLTEAINRMPNWPAPQIELGLLLTQSGKEDTALAVLRRANNLDQFNKRAINTLKMLEALAGYHTVETEHFIIKYRDTIDGALARDMPDELEDIYRDVTGVYEQPLGFKTFIEIMPDKRWFAIRITGMPWIWTIGACTGPVIAITPPREGSHHSGPFDWARVMRHEFVHTVTLDRTANRIPHWFTEACAVSQELGPRDLETSMLLAESLASGELFDLQEINWAFVRPRRPQDRALAYAQAHWMYEYITEKYGHATILKILDLCREGTPETQLIQTATGVGAEQFLSEFHIWAAEQVQRWGLSPSPKADGLLKQIAEAGEDGAEEKLKTLLETYPNHPDLLRLAAEHSVEHGEDDAATLELVKRYAEARPVDPWADRQIAELALKLNQPELAAVHLERLDSLDQETGDHARALMQLYRQTGKLDDAQRACRSALYRQPYDASLRETAATIALQRADADTALHHLNALTLIEEDRSIHFTRKAALLHRMGKADEAHAAATKARELDPKAPVDSFLK